MTPEGKRRLRALTSDVNAILWRDWDPIGCGVPEDEYASYAPEVVRLLTEGAPAGEIAAYLREASAGMMRAAVPERRLAEVVAKLMALRGGEGEAR
jgi:hypothetical protein